MKKELASRNLRITPTAYRTLTRLARQERRSLAGMVWVAVDAYAAIVNRKNPISTGVMR